jgi:site-specific DNA-methyltransferase (adenine-specific)
MQIVEKKITELKAYEKNPRKNEKAVAPVAESIKEFGFKVPVIIDSVGVIVAGHTRLRAAKKLGMKTVPCIVADDLTPQQIKAFRLADNKVSEFAEWDIDLLTSELKEIDLDMDVFGFDEDFATKPELETKELKPFQKVHYLITADVNDNDKIIKILAELKKVEGIEIDSTLN